MKTVFPFYYMSLGSIVVAALAIFVLLLGLTLAAYEVGLLTFGRTVVEEARYVEPVSNVSAIAVHVDIGNAVFKRGPRPECVSMSTLRTTGYWSTRPTPAPLSQGRTYPSGRG